MWIFFYANPFSARACVLIKKPKLENRKMCFFFEKVVPPNLTRPSERPHKIIEISSLCGGKDDL